MAGFSKWQLRRGGVGLFIGIPHSHLLRRALHRARIRRGTDANKNSVCFLRVYVFPRVEFLQWRLFSLRYDIYSFLTQHPDAVEMEIACIIISE